MRSNRLYYIVPKSKLVDKHETANVKDIICINVGRAGVRIGDQCIKQFAEEHDVGGKAQTPNPFFTKTGKGKSVANSIFIDLEPSTIEQVKIAEDSWIYDKNCFIAGKEDAGGNFARGYREPNDPFVEEALRGIKNLAESKSQLQGFIVSHAFGGGTGSGLMSCLMEELSDLFPKKSKISFSVLSGNQTATSGMDSYNTILGLHKTIEDFDVSFLFSNEATGDIIEKQLYSDINFQFTNDLMVQAMSCITASSRFDGGMNKYLKEYPASIAPFPRLHFPITGFSPLSEDKKDRKDKRKKEKSLTSLSYEALVYGNQFVEANVLEAKTMACCYLYRGDIQMSDANKTSKELKDKKVLNFPMTAPSYKVNVIKQPIVWEEGDFLPESAKNKCVCSLVNSTAICDTLCTQIKRLENIREKKAFEHWIIGEGILETMDLDDAEDDIKILNNEYLEIISTE